MINKKLLINDYEQTKKLLMLKNVSYKIIEEARKSILEKLELQQKVEKYREELNSLGDLMKKAGGNNDEIKNKILLLKKSLKEEEPLLDELKTKEQELLYQLPNFPSPDAPIGTSEKDNVILKTVGYDPKNYQDKHYEYHWDLGEKLDIFDPKRATKISGSMFSLLKGDGARLLRALISLALDLNRHKYEEVIAPHFVSTTTITGTGHLPKFKDDQYKIEGEELWADPTAEVPLTGMHINETFKEEELPKRYMAYCVSFRKEAGSAGKDTRGMQRLHEFHKVEMFEICKPDTVVEEWLGMVSDAEQIIKLLELPYRIVDLCTGDMGDKYARCYDIEVYSPGVDKWLEVSSVGYFTDYQARRCNMKYLTKTGTKELVYTLNGSAMATPRVWAAIIENYQNRDGSITIPKVLRSYMSNMETIKKAN